MQDLVGPPKKIIGVENIKSVLSFQLEVIPTRRYFVGFMPNPLPQINSLSVQFRDGLEIKKEWTLLETDVGNWDTIRYYKFSKKNRTEYFDANTQTYYFFNMPAEQGVIHNIF